MIFNSQASHHENSATTMFHKTQQQYKYINQLKMSFIIFLLLNFHQSLIEFLKTTSLIFKI